MGPSFCATQLRRPQTYSRCASAFVRLFPVEPVIWGLTGAPLAPLAHRISAIDRNRFLEPKLRMQAVVSTMIHIPNYLSPEGLYTQRWRTTSARQPRLSAGVRDLEPRPPVIAIQRRSQGVRTPAGVQIRVGVPWSWVAPAQRLSDCRAMPRLSASITKIQLIILK
jgi:hypothetical protein